MTLVLLLLGCATENLKGEIPRTGAQPSMGEPRRVGGNESFLRDLASESEPNPRDPQVRKGMEDGRTQVIELQFEGKTRRYRVVPPDGYDAKRAWPVLIGYHGGGEGNTGVKMEVNWLPQRGGPQFLVFPDGDGGGWFVPGEGGGGPDTDPMRDVRFTDVMLADLKARWNIDKDEVYAVGFSNGAMFVWTLICNNPEPFAGFAAVSAGMTDRTLSACSPQKTRPILYIHGTNDHNFAGRVSEGEHQLRITSSAETVQAITAAYNCKGEPAADRRADRCSNGRVPVVQSFDTCKDKGKIEYVKVENGSHAWPGGREKCSNVDNDMILSFFGLSGQR
ncbi:MAG: hypothetical protein ABMA64_14740 [Myxococcota bacterium]